MKITLTSDTSLRLEPDAGPMTIEAPTADRQYSPFHMLASGLAFCTYSILASWAAQRDVAADSLALDVVWSFAEHPHRVGAMRVGIAWPALPEDRRAVADRVAALCAVHATLTHPPAITIELDGAGVEEGEAPASAGGRGGA